MKRTGGTLSVVCIALDDLDEKTPDTVVDMKKMMYNSAIQIIIDNVRIFDMIGKFDNDNHIYICMIDATENDAYNVANRFSQKIFESKFYIDGHDEITTTICAGISSITVYKDTETKISKEFEARLRAEIGGKIKEEMRNEIENLAIKTFKVLTKASYPLRAINLSLLTTSSWQFIPSIFDFVTKKCIVPLMILSWINATNTLAPENIRDKR